MLRVRKRAARLPFNATRYFQSAPFELATPTARGVYSACEWVSRPRVVITKQQVL